MINIVHWKNVVGKDKLDTFTGIQMAVTLGESKGIDELETLNRAIKSGKATEDDIEMWREKRRLMRKCGYEYDGKIIRWHGWYVAVVEKGELRFRGTANDLRIFIPMNEYLEWLKGQDTGEPKQYNVTSVINRTMRDIEKPKVRADIDDTFVEERE